MSRRRSVPVVGGHDTPGTAGRTHEVSVVRGTYGSGGAGCPITLDDPDVAGVAGSRLGGGPGGAVLGAAHTLPAPRPGAVVHHTTGHRGGRGRGTRAAGRRVVPRGG